jgi:hypothetical protein|uniref:Uncharacterized protein n=1 Tax=viral metagenome TaxID=1070528 RepID=A0A6C0BGM0_9ZZZZ
MTYEQKLSMQGVEVTLKLNYSANEVIFDLILTSESGEKLETTGCVTHMKDHVHLTQMEKEYEERVQEEKFSPTYLSQQVKRISSSSTFEEKRISFIECMTYLYAHREEIVRYRNFLDIMIYKCYEIKAENPTDSELNGVCDKILTHFGLETDMEVYAQKKAEKEEASKKQEHIEVAKAPNPCNASVSMEPRLKDREEHLRLLEKVAKTYDIPFATKMYEQYMDWKVTYQGNARNRYQRMCEFIESLPLFK